MIIFHTLSVQNRTTLNNSWTTKSTHFNEGSFKRLICFLTIASNAISGVKRPTYWGCKCNMNYQDNTTRSSYSSKYINILTLIPWIFLIAKAISLRNSFSSNSILTISNGNLSWKRRLILAPPDSSFVLMSADPEPSIVRSKSDCSCWIILWNSKHTRLQHTITLESAQPLQKVTHWSIAFVLMDGSPGLKYLYWSTSFSSINNCFWSLSRRPGSVSRMWLVSCWFSTRWRYGVPSLSAKWRYEGWLKWNKTQHNFRYQNQCVKIIFIIFIIP